MIHVESIGWCGRYWVPPLAKLGFMIGVVRCALIYVGPRRMGQASDERKDQHEETMEAMRIQHEKIMRALGVHHEALRELIAQTAR